MKTKRNKDKLLRPYNLISIQVCPDCGKLDVSKGHVCTETYEERFSRNENLWK